MTTLFLVSLAIILVSLVCHLLIWASLALEAECRMLDEHQRMVEAQEAARACNRAALALEAQAVPTPTHAPLDVQGRWDALMAYEVLMHVPTLKGECSLLSCTNCGACDSVPFTPPITGASMEDLVNKQWALNHVSEQVVCTHGTHQYGVDLMSTCMEEDARVRGELVQDTYDEQVYEDECVCEDAREYSHTWMYAGASHSKGKDSKQVKAKRMAMRLARHEALSMRDMDGGNYMVTGSDMQVAATTPKRDRDTRPQCTGCGDCAYMEPCRHGCDIEPWYMEGMEEYYRDYCPACNRKLSRCCCV